MTRFHLFLYSFLLFACGKEHCFNFITTTSSTTNGSLTNTTTIDTSVYCGITEDEAKTMANSRTRTYNTGNTTYTIKVSYKVR